MQIIRITNADSFTFSSGYSNIFYNATNNETGLSLIEPLLPSSQKFPYSDLYTQKRVELTNNNEISDYLYFAELSSA